MSKRRRKARQRLSRGRKHAEAYEARLEAARELQRHAEQVRELAADTIMRTDNSLYDVVRELLWS